MHKLFKYVWHAVGESRPFDRENLFSPKKTPKNSHVFVKKNGITSLWENLEAKLLTPGQPLGYPCKHWGITVQTSYCEGWWHQNWVRSRPTNYSLSNWNGNSWKTDLFYSSASNSKTKRDIGMGHKRWRARYTWGNKRLLGEKWLQAIFYRVLPAWSWEMPVERELPAKIG